MPKTTYIEANLLEDERIIYRGSRHWVVFLQIALWFLVARWVAMFFSGVSYIETVFTIFVILTAGYGISFYFFSEIAITSQRVVVKDGWLIRNVYEVNLQDVSTVRLEQSWLGRLLNFGTLFLLDQNGFSTPIRFLSNPLLFRQTVQAELHKQSQTASE